MRVTSVLQRVRQAMSAPAGSLPVLVVLALVAGVVGYFLLAPGLGTTPQAFDPSAGRPTASEDSGSRAPEQSPAPGADAAASGSADPEETATTGTPAGADGADGPGAKGTKGGKEGGPAAGVELPSDLDCLLEAPVPTALSVLTYNIHGGSGDLRRIAAELRAWNADVLLLQEVDRRRRGAQAAQLAAWLGMHHVYGGLEAKGRQARRGNAILSRYPITDTEVVPLPFFPGPKAKQRALVRATISVDGQLVDVFNTHLQHIYADDRVRQARVVRPIVTRSLRPRLLGGDFNALPGSAPYRQLAAGMVDLWRAVGAGPGYTSPNRRPNHRIDYLLADRSITPIEVAVMGPGVSDHRAVRAVLELPADGPPCTEEE